MSNKKPMQTIAGLATARGFAIGPVFVYRGSGDVPIPEYVVDPGHEADELVRLKRAVLETKRDLELMISTLRERAGRADVKVFECHLMMLEDFMFLDEDEETGIASACDNDEQAREAHKAYHERYDMNGRQLKDSARKGLYVRKGAKYLNK